MKIEISTEFETSLLENYRTKITARIVDGKGQVLATGDDSDAWSDGKERRASAKAATAEALGRLEHLLANARDVAKKSGLL